ETERGAGGEAFLYYVMPYIEGETLRDKLNRETQLGIEEAVRITCDVADALDYAHSNNVIHRDIKPENILLHNGRPMVADFGIALAVSAAAGGRMTETGISLGTPHYMSPEQATAEKDLTNRSDIYSLACVLYEMLTGEPPHTGASAQAIVMKIVTEDVQPVTELRKSVPPHVAAATAKSLEKLAADRFGTAKEFAEALTNPAFTLPATQASAVGSAPASGPWNRLSVGLAAIVTLLLGTMLWGWLRPEPAPGVARYGLAFPPGQELTDVRNQSFALAPDGSWIVYDGPAESGSQLWIKRREEYSATPLPGTNNQGGSAPAVSPDGEWIVFTAGGQLRKVPRGGGSAITVADSVSMTTRGVAWLDDGTIVYVDTDNRLRRVPDVGGDAEIVWSPPPDSGMRPRLPTPLPDARGVLFGHCVGTCSPSTIWVLDLRSGEARELVPGVTQAWYVATGHVVYVRRDGGVFAAPFDQGSLAFAGPAVPVLEGVGVAASGLFPDLALSQSGSLLMIAGEGIGGGLERVEWEAVWVSREGTVTQVDPTWRFRMPLNPGWDLSPDGSRLAIGILDEVEDPTQQRGDYDIWIKELDEGPASRLTVHASVDLRPRWTPDGRSVSFISTRDGNFDLFSRVADATLPVKSVFAFEENIWESVWSLDGEWLVLRTNLAGQRNLWALRVGVDSVPTRLLTSEFDENAVALSPDGKWLAYQSDETGQNEVYVRPFPDVTAGKQTVSVGGGSLPLWAHSGRELFYVDSEDQLVAAKVTTSTAFAVRERRRLFSVEQYRTTGTYRSFDISPDDQRFLMVRATGIGDEGPASALILVENWFEELKAKVGND
ncbi:MAG: protein kinase, partial [Gemmatimonadetes bacterium]|nr:protein kinase [Gemmatimonadota bacterium]